MKASVKTGAARTAASLTIPARCGTASAIFSLGPGTATCDGAAAHRTGRACLLGDGRLSVAAQADCATGQHDDGPGIGLDQSRQNADDRLLARPVGPEQRDTDRSGARMSTRPMPMSLRTLREPYEIG
jgi:hypothetical protein